MIEIRAFRSSLLDMRGPERLGCLEIHRSVATIRFNGVTYSRILLMLPRLVRPRSAAHTRSIPWPYRIAWKRSCQARGLARLLRSKASRSLTARKPLRKAGLPEE
jgi:hypothetical protein